MKRIYSTLKVILPILFFSFTLIGCGGGGGDSSSGSSTGTVSISMTDAKPVLPNTSGKMITNVFVTIDEVLVHKSGSGWETLHMVQTPYTIDLLQFSPGNTTEFVPPIALSSGKYTQVRLSVVSARLRFKNDPNDEVEITIPSENLKTDKNFDFDLIGGTAVDITIDFDLSKSLVLDGPDYKLKPVLHIVETADAATIRVAIENTSFLFPSDPEPDYTPYVVITVLDSTGQEYTKVQVNRNGSSAPNARTIFWIFWIVPDQDYEVDIDYDPVTNPGANLDDFRPVSASAVGPGETAFVCFPVTVQVCP